MKVIDNSQNKIEFGTVPTGHVFEYDGEIYMVTSPFRVSNATVYNAVCLTDGLWYTFKANAEVTPCLAQIEIIKKGSYT